MALETTLRRFSLFTLLAQMANGEPPPSGMQPKIHWVGQKKHVEQKQETGEERGGGSPKKDERGYRELSSITLSEVNDAYKYYANQLRSGPAPGWIAPNYFCMIHLLPKRDNRPPVVFGRVKTTYPSDGYLQNVQEWELRLPGRNRPPDLVHLRANEVFNTPAKLLQSFCVRVQFFLHPDDQAEFAAHQSLFLQQGYLPEFSQSYLDLLDLNEGNQALAPWLYVISSRWFTSIPVTMQPEIREKLTKLVHWNKLIFNYHPEHLPHEVPPSWSRSCRRRSSSPSSVPRPARATRRCGSTGPVPGSTSGTTRRPPCRGAARFSAPSPRKQRSGSNSPTANGRPAGTGRKVASGAPPLPPHRPRTQNVPERRPPGATCSWPAISPTPSSSCARCARFARAPGWHGDAAATHLQTLGVLGFPRLPPAAASRHRDGRGDDASGDIPARARPRSLERGLRAAIPAARRRPRPAT